MIEPFFLSSPTMQAYLDIHSLLVDDLFGEPLQCHDASSIAHLDPEVLVENQLSQGLGQVSRVARRHEEPILAILNHLTATWDIGRDAGAARGHGLYQGEGKAFAVGGEAGDVGVLEQRGHVIDITEPFDISFILPLEDLRFGDAGGISGVRKSSKLYPYRDPLFLQGSRGLDEITHSLVPKEARGKDDDRHAFRGCLITDLQPGRLQRMARGKSAQ